MQALKTNYKGKGKWASVAKALNQIGSVINSMIGFGGIDVAFVGNEIRITGAGAVARGSFSGRVYLGGKLYEPGVWSAYGPDPWVRVKVGETFPVVSYEAGPAPDPFPPDEEWFRVASTYGDIHVTRL